MESYQDAKHQWHTSPAATVEAILRTMGASEDRPHPAADEPVIFLRPGETRAVEGAAVLRTEDGAEMQVDSDLPTDLPLGYHRLTRLDDGSVKTVIVTPGRCPRPPNAPTWGWAVQ